MARLLAVAKHTMVTPVMTEVAAISHSFSSVGCINSSFYF